MSSLSNTILIGSSSPAFRFHPARLTADPFKGWRRGICISQPSVCNFNVTSGQPAPSDYYYSNNEEASIIFQFPINGTSITLWASGDLSAPGSSCRLNVSASNDSGKAYNQVMTVNSKPIQTHPIQFPGSCDKCIINFFLLGCTGNSLFYFAGLMLTSNDQPAVLCDSDITFLPDSDWNSGSNVQPPSQIVCPPGQNVTISSHSTNMDNAYASIKFNGSGVAVSGTINSTTYSVILDDTDYGEHPDDTDYREYPEGAIPPMLSADALFALLDLDTKSEHILRIVNHRNVSENGNLTLSSIQVFGDASISRNPQSSNPPGPPEQSSNSPTPPKQSSKTPMAAIIGGAVGGAAFILLLGIALLFLRRSHRKNKNRATLVNDKAKAPPFDSPIDLVQTELEISPFVMPSETGQGGTRGDMRERHPKGHLLEPNTSGFYHSGRSSSYKMFESPSAPPQSITDSRRINEEGSHGNVDAIGEREDAARTRDRLDAIERLVVSLAEGLNSGLEEAPPSYAQV